MVLGLHSIRKDRMQVLHHCYQDWGSMEGQAVMALIIKDLVLIKVILVVHQTITWLLSQKEDMIRIVVVLIMALRGVPFEEAKTGVMVETVEVCKTDEDLIQISMMILTDQMNFVMTFIQTRDLATAYVNLREGEARPKKTNGDVEVQALLSPLITENLVKERAGVQIVDLLDLGMDGDLQMSDFLMTLKIHGTGEEGMKVSGEVHLQGMRAVDPGGETVFLGLMTLCQKIILTRQRRIKEEEIMVSGHEVEVLQEEVEKVCFPLQMSFHTLKEVEWMEIETQALARITLLTMVTLLQVENVLPQFRGWTWPHCPLASVLGMMDREPLSTETWTISKEDLQRREERGAENQDLRRECQNRGDPAL
uniref:Uncharacterized protein n=1 Tax=Sphaerodactylus townsendi TaxID=933632 RepID=A0ACB8FAF2_9SAUR